MRTRLFIYGMIAYLSCPWILLPLTTSDYHYPLSIRLGIEAGLPKELLKQDDEEEQEKQLQEETNEWITEMEGLTLVKEKYASNFIREDTEEKNVFYYKLPDAQYYLVYEGGDSGTEYLYHLYEFVTDDTEEGIGHYVTYGWYTVDKYTGEITERIH
jgi:hypothetical protein